MSNDAPHTYDLTLLDQSAATWRQSPALRLIYSRLYARAKDLAKDGPALEVGAGIGSAKEFWPDLTTSDIEHTRYVDRAADAYALSETGVWATIFAMDVLHHLCEPFRFFESAANALEPGGRLILIEPAATMWGAFLYTLCHHEPCMPDLLKPPFVIEPDPTGEFANMGMGQALFGQHAEWTHEHLQEIGLKLITTEYHDIIAYFLTGGFSKRLPTPTMLVGAVASMEELLPKFCKGKLGTRMTLALEKVRP